MRNVLLIVSAFVLSRAVLFMHELTHLTPRDVPGLRAVWNALVQYPAIASVVLDLVRRASAQTR